MKSLRSIELFAGAGGLALGLSQVGFKHDAVVEWNQHACNTIRYNQLKKSALVKDWPLHQMDVREFDYSGLKEEPDLLAGGPPCQPFSIGGKHRGYKDRRNMFPEIIRAIRELKPRAVIIENVRGLLRPSFSHYFEYLLLQVMFPEINPHEGEMWKDHQARLEKYQTKGRPKGLWYRPIFQPLNAASFGVPQRRERVFIVAFRSDQEFEWSFPRATHSMEALLWDQWVTGEYWERHQVAKRNRPQMPSRLESKVRQLKTRIAPFQEKPVRTVRDMMTDLPDPTRGDCNVPNHIYIPGARIYKGHTGSPLDEPAKTLKAGDHGVPGGENMVAFPDGKVRYFTVRESARLQTFPDQFLFAGSWTENMRQLGNAVPVELARSVAQGIAEALAPNS